ncbi:MoaD/ThiS family protein [Thermodesulfobacteriota bacterium]
MIVTIKLFPSLHGCTPPNEQRLENDKWDMPEDCSIAKALEILKLSEPEAKLFFLNNEKAEKDQVMREGDELQVYPPIGGG